jgi:8-oxo-dGTP pyrophosphatase MutT (NUDIX family)
LISKWQTLEDRFVQNLKIFNVRFKKRINPSTGVASEFVTLDSPNWVNIIAITGERKIVMVEQYRHGTDSITYELPGGMVEIDENYANAAMRECIEETGYVGEGTPLKIGEVQPNPAFMNNICTTFLWENCSLKHSQNLDSNELINVKEFSVEDIKSMIDKGEIKHAIILNAFFFYFMKMNSNYTAW